jgi:hypothetical protein
MNSAKKHGRKNRCSAFEMAHRSQDAKRAAVPTFSLLFSRVLTFPNFGRGFDSHRPLHKVDRVDAVGRGRIRVRCSMASFGFCSLARSAAPLSSLSNRSSPLPTVAAFRATHQTAPEIGRRPTRSREARSERIVHRCQLPFDGKRGSGAGPTRRGKGSKIMAISDGHSLPVAVHVNCASPHETKPVESTIERRLLAETPQRLIGDRA